MKTLKLFAIVLLFAAAGFAQNALVMPLCEYPFFLNNGSIASNGFLYTYQSGTLTPQATFTDSTGLTQNNNPIQLNAAGFPTSPSGAQICVWGQSGQTYRYVLQNAAHVQQYQVDGIVGLISTATGQNQTSTTVSFSATPTFTATGQNQLFKMTLTGNVTSSTLVMTGISAPSIVAFELTQDGTGSRSFVWPLNVVGGSTQVGSFGANVVMVQEFLWDGTTATAVSPLQSNPAAGFVGSFNEIQAIGRVSAGGSPGVGSVAGDLTAARSTTNGVLYLGNDGNRAIVGNGNLIEIGPGSANAEIKIDNGIFSDSSGVKHKRSATTCTTAASTGSICTTAAISWGTAFADNSYTLSCMLNGTTNEPVLIGATNKGASSFQLIIGALINAAATYSEVDCIGIHD